MEEKHETDVNTLVSEIDNVTIHDSEASVSSVEDKVEPSSSDKENSYDNLFDQLKEKKKHIFVLSTAGKPIYTR